MPRKKSEKKKEENPEEKSKPSESMLEDIGNTVSEKEKPKLEKLDISALKKEDKKIFEVIEKLAKEGISKSKIGLILRDSYGVPKSKFIGKKIGVTLKEKGMESDIPEDFSDLLKRSDELRRHLDKNKQDKSAKRGLQIVESKIKKLSYYYKKKKIIPESWKR